MAGKKRKLRERWLPVAVCTCPITMCDCSSTSSARVRWSGVAPPPGDCSSASSARRRATARCRGPASSRGCSAPPGTTAPPRGRCFGPPPPPLRATRARRRRLGRSWGCGDVREEEREEMWCMCCCLLIFCRDKEERDADTRPRQSFSIFPGAVVAVARL